LYLYNVLTNIFDFTSAVISSRLNYNFDKRHAFDISFLLHLVRNLMSLMLDLSFISVFISLVILAEVGSFFYSNHFSLYPLDQISMIFIISF